jgi:phage shock protein PspC (stress-responsive transcriptional regulator)
MEWVTLMRENITTAVEIAGAGSVCAGIGLHFGFDFGLIVGGIFALVFSYLAGNE